MICNVLQITSQLYADPQMRDTHNGGKNDYKGKTQYSKNKFWIVEKDGERIGTLFKQEDKRYMYSCSQAQIILQI